jgi:hypothetical protein
MILIHFKNVGRKEIIDVAYRDQHMFMEMKQMMIHIMENLSVLVLWLQNGLSILGLNSVERLLL